MFSFIFKITAINRGEIKDSEMESIMDSIVDSLFSVFATLGIYMLVVYKSNLKILRCCKLFLLLCHVQVLFQFYAVPEEMQLKWLLKN